MTRRQSKNPSQQHREMRLKIVIGILCLLWPVPSNANPCILNPSSLIAFGVVSSAALAVEAGLVALILAFVGLSPLRTFGGYLLANAIVFLFIFLPLQSHLSLPVLESLIVAIDAVSIKFPSKFGTFQADSFINVRWPVAAFTSLTGNAASFCIGLIASGSPWSMHGLGD